MLYLDGNTWYNSRIIYKQLKKLKKLEKLMIVDDKWLKARAEEIRAIDRIDPALYQKYNVKRGLRNSDGTGVLVGLTTIGNVHGYVVSEGEKQPI